MPTLEPNDLPGYIVGHYSHFMTPEEASERKALFIEYKELCSELESEFGRVPAGKFTFKLPDESCNDQRWKEYNERRKRFFERTSKRILEEHKDAIHLNYCPYCGALARTPKAKQCGLCYKRWA